MNQDEPGAKPAKIDPAQVLGSDDAIEKIAEDVNARVASPSYNAQRESIAQAPTPPSSDSGRNIMQASFDPSATVPEYIRGTLEQLNSIHKFFHGRDVQKIQRSQVLKLTRELFDYQYKDMQHLLMLGMDVQKKTRFVQYLNATKSLQNRIQRESAEALLAVVGTMFDNRMEAYKAKNARDIELNKMLKSGVLDNKQYEKSKQDNEVRTDEHVQRLDQTADLLMTRHSEFLYKTLELFKTQLIDSGKI